MIFYTLKGPTYKMEIHDDKIYLKKSRWVKFLTKEPHVIAYELNKLTHFEVTSPKMFMLWGKLEWSTSAEQKGSFRFTTNAVMVDKIEKYMQKRIEKNVQNKKKPVEPVALVQSPYFHAPVKVEAPVMEAAGPAVYVTSEASVSEPIIQVPVEAFKQSKKSKKKNKKHKRSEAA